ncbi:hypothetical protein ACLB2K_026447 [Fragaria x ananassa]
MEFEYREYEWRWLLVTQFNDPHKQHLARVNAENRQQNTTNHRAGSRPFSAIMDDVRRERPEENPYVGTFQRAYPHSEEDLARVREAEQEVMRGMVNDTWPGTAEEDMSEAMSRIDTSDPTVGARIMATAFAQRSNTYYCRGMGGAGKGILKMTPGFQRKLKKFQQKLKKYYLYI